jgi:hypothetical protein
MSISINISYPCQLLSLSVIHVKLYHYQLSMSTSITISYPCQLISLSVIHVNFYHYQYHTIVYLGVMHKTKYWSIMSLHALGISVLGSYSITLCSRKSCSIISWVEILLKKNGKNRYICKHSEYLRCAWCNNRFVSFVPLTSLFLPKLNVTFYNGLQMKWKKTDNTRNPQIYFLFLYIFISRTWTEWNWWYF